MGEAPRPAPHPRATSGPRSPTAQLFFDLWGLALIAAGSIAHLNHLFRELGPYDESIVLVNAWLMNDGAAPYRDFYSNYPPGTFALVGLFFHIFGEHVLVARAVGILVHLAVALLGGHLAGRVRGRRFSPLASGLILLWISRLGLTPLAFLCGLALALGAAAFFHRAQQAESRGAWLLCGACAGAGTYFRHDYLVWTSVSLSALAAAWWALGWRRKPKTAWVGAFGWSLAGAATTAAVLWTPVFWRAGLQQPLDDLFFDQVRYVLPGRLLPMPNLLQGALPTGPLSPPFILPSLLHTELESALLIVFLGPPVGLGLLLLAKRLQLDAPLLAVLIALGLASLPQALGRTDRDHVVYGMTPALVLCWVAAEAWAARLPRWAAWSPLAVTMLLLGFAQRGLVRWAVKLDPKVPRMENARGSRVVGLPHRDALVKLIQEKTAPGEPIYVGLTDHRRTRGNELDLYFLAERPGSTRHLQFDPNVVNRADVQRQIIRDLEAKQTKLIVVSPYYAEGGEPNTSEILGSELLDQYLAATFETCARFDEWEVKLRRSPPR